jgi:hypothetical protein
MLNEKLLRDKNEFSFFTYTLLNRIANSKQPVKVKMRNGQWINVSFQAVSADCLEPCFYAEDWEYVWNADGSSYENWELDLIEIED